MKENGGVPLSEQQAKNADLDFAPCEIAMALRPSRTHDAHHLNIGILQLQAYLDEHAAELGEAKRVRVTRLVGSRSRV